MIQKKRDNSTECRVFFCVNPSIYRLNIHFNIFRNNKLLSLGNVNNQDELQVSLKFGFVHCNSCQFFCLCDSPFNQATALLHNNGQVCMAMLLLRVFAGLRFSRPKSLIAALRFCFSRRDGGVIP